MGTIGYGYGSEWNLLRYLGRHRQMLDKEILMKTGGSDIHWLDFDFKTSSDPLNWDRELKGLEFLPESAQRKWAEFWPRTGNVQNWDAVGQLTTNNSKWLLVEAKANIEETMNPCGAKNKGLEIIRRAMESTQKAFNASGVPIENWLGDYYQFCNRLATLHFMDQVGEPARLVLIYFYGDRVPGCSCPASAREWETEFEKMKNCCGVDTNSELWSRVHPIYLSVNPKGL